MVSSRMVDPPRQRVISTCRRFFPLEDLLFIVVLIYRHQRLIAIEAIVAVVVLRCFISRNCFANGCYTNAITSGCSIRAVNNRRSVHAPTSIVCRTLPRCRGSTYIVDRVKPKEPIAFAQLVHE